MVEKIDQKKCRDISIEIQATLAKWGKYFFYYSIENLRKQLSLKKAYQYDYRIVRDGEVKYCRAKFVNTSDGGQLHRMVAGFRDRFQKKSLKNFC